MIVAHDHQVVEAGVDAVYSSLNSRAVGAGCDIGVVDGQIIQPQMGQVEVLVEVGDVAFVFHLIDLPLQVFGVLVGTLELLRFHLDKLMCTMAPIPAPMPPSRNRIESRRKSLKRGALFLLTSTF